MSGKSDAELVEMVRELGDKDAFGQLVRRYQGHAYGLAYSILGNWTDEEKSTLNDRMKAAGEIILSFGTAGLEQTMNTYNNK